MEKKLLFSIFIKHFTFLLILGYIGVSSISFSYLFSDSGSHHTEYCHSIESNSLAEDTQKEVEDKFGIELKDNMLLISKQAKKQDAIAEMPMLHHAAISTPPPNAHKHTISIFLAVILFALNQFLAFIVHGVVC